MVELKDFYSRRISLVEQDGWRDLMEELDTLSQAVDSVDSLENERDLWFARGQLSVLRQMLSLDEATKLAMEELDL